jgi:hypothetical protein
MNTLIELANAYATCCWSDGANDMEHPNTDKARAALIQGIEALQAENADLETRWAEWKDSLNSVMEQRNALQAEVERFQEQRREAGKEVGTERSLCDGMAWLYKHVSKVEAERDALRAELDALKAQEPERNYLQDIAACIGVGGYNGANDEQLYQRICDEFSRVTAPQAPAPEADAERQERDVSTAKSMFANFRLEGEHAALNAALSHLWPNAFSHGFQVAKGIYTAPQAPSFPFVPWSKEAEMIESWAAPQAPSPTGEGK